MKARRVLHILRGMHRGGIETWLMQILRHVDRREIDMHFLIQTPEPQAYDEEIRALGSQLLLCEGWPDRPLHFVRNFQRILRESGPFDVIHSHPFLASGAILRLAASEGVPIRQVIGIGGVSKKSPFVMQVLADVLNMPIKIVQSEQACALGAAICAATAAGV